jgi:hypothetical protein
MGTQIVQMKGVITGWFVELIPCAGTRYFCPALAALVSPVQILFSSPHTFVPGAQQPGQAGVLGRLSLCLWSELIEDSGRD